MLPCYAADDKDAYQTCVLQDSEEAADACRRRVIDELKKNPDYQAASKRDKFGAWLEA